MMIKKRIAERTPTDVAVLPVPRLRLQVGQRRRRYQNDPSLSWPQVDPAYRALHRTGADWVQTLVPGLSYLEISRNPAREIAKFPSAKIVEPKRPRVRPHIKGGKWNKSRVPKTPLPVSPTIEKIGL